MGAPIFNNGARTGKSQNELYAEDQRKKMAPDSVCLNGSLRYDTPTYRWRDVMMVMSFVWPMNSQLSRNKDELDV